MVRKGKKNGSITMLLSTLREGKTQTTRVGDFTRERRQKLQNESVQSVAARIRARKKKRG